MLIFWCDSFNDVFDVVVVVLKLRLMLMVRLLSRIMSMTVLMACIHMVDVRHLFASAYYQLPLHLS